MQWLFSRLLFSFLKQVNMKIDLFLLFFVKVLSDLQNTRFPTESFTNLTLGFYLSLLKI